VLEIAPPDVDTGSGAAATPRGRVASAGWASGVDGVDGVEGVEGVDGVSEEFHGWTALAAAIERRWSRDVPAPPDG